MKLKHSRRHNINTYTIKKTLQIMPFLWRGSPCRAARLSYSVTDGSQRCSASVPPSVRGAFEGSTAKRVKNKLKSRCESRNEGNGKSRASAACAHARLLVWRQKLPLAFWAFRAFTVLLFLVTWIENLYTKGSFYTPGNRRSDVNKQRGNANFSLANSSCSRIALF